MSTPSFGERVRMWWKSVTKQDEPTNSIASRTLASAMPKLEAPRFDGPLKEEYTYPEEKTGETSLKSDVVKDLVLSCHVQAAARDVVFIWTKDGQEIYPNDHIRIVCLCTSTRLCIRCPQTTDSGEYCCEAANPEGRCKTTTRLRVEQSVEKQNKEENEVDRIGKARLRRTSWSKPESGEGSQQEKVENNRMWRQSLSSSQETDSDEYGHDVDALPECDRPNPPQCWIEKNNRWYQSLPQQNQVPDIQPSLGVPRTEEISREYKKTTRRPPATSNLSREIRVAGNHLHSGSHHHDTKADTHTEQNSISQKPETNETKTRVIIIRPRQAENANQKDRHMSLPARLTPSGMPNIQFDPHLSAERRLNVKNLVNTYEREGLLVQLSPTEFGHNHRTHYYGTRHGSVDAKGVRYRTPADRNGRDPQWKTRHSSLMTMVSSQGSSVEEDGPEERKQSPRGLFQSSLSAASEKSRETGNQNEKSYQNLMSTAVDLGSSRPSKPGEQNANQTENTKTNEDRKQRPDASTRANSADVSHTGAKEETPLPTKTEQSITPEATTEVSSTNTRDYSEGIRRLMSLIRRKLSVTSETPETSTTTTDSPKPPEPSERTSEAQSSKTSESEIKQSEGTVQPLPTLSPSRGPEQTSLPGLPDNADDGAAKRRQIFRTKNTVINIDQDEIDITDDRLPVNPERRKKPSKPSVIMINYSFGSDTKKSGGANAQPPSVEVEIDSQTPYKQPDEKDALTHSTPDNSTSTREKQRKSVFAENPPTQPKHVVVPYIETRQTLPDQFSTSDTEKCMLTVPGIRKPLSPLVEGVDSPPDNSSVGPTSPPPAIKPVIITIGPKAHERNKSNIPKRSEPVTPRPGMVKACAHSERTEDGIYTHHHSSCDQQLNKPKANNNGQRNDPKCTSSSLFHLTTPQPSKKFSSTSLLNDLKTKSNTAVPEASVTKRPHLDASLILPGADYKPPSSTTSDHPKPDTLSPAPGATGKSEGDSDRDRSSLAVTPDELQASFKLLPGRPTEDDKTDVVEYPLNTPTQKNVDPSNDFGVCLPLGKGKFGSVHKCMEKATGKTFALKRFRTVRLPRHNGDLMEVAVLKAIGKHPQIAYLHAVYEYKGYCTLVTELVLGGALFDRIQQEDTLDEAVTVCIIRQVLLGLCHLKKCQVLHCDLKPENLVMVEPRGYRLKIIDFGLACFYDPKMRRRPAGTLTYLAPETQNYDPQSYSTDLWSVAVIAYEILSGITPFEIPQDGDLTRKLSDAEISLNITQVRYNFEDEGIVDASAEAKDFIKKILVRNPIRRPAVEECLVHPWIKMPDIKRSKVMRSVSLFRQGSQRVLQRGNTFRLPIRSRTVRRAQ